MKSANQWCRILEPEKTYSTSSPFIHSLFILYLNLEAINVLKHTDLKKNETSLVSDVSKISLFVGNPVLAEVPGVAYGFSKSVNTRYKTSSTIKSANLREIFSFSSFDMYIFSLFTNPLLFSKF